jgi:protease-4
MSYLLYAWRLAWWLLGNLRRRLSRPPDFVLFTLAGEFSDYTEARGNFIQRRLRPPRPSLQELADRFEQIAADPRVRGVILHLRRMQMPAAQLETLRELIAGLKAAGKRVAAWSTYYNSGDYYAACAADLVLLQPAGGIEPLGLVHHYHFLAEALQRVGLQGDFLPISPYKSAGDILTRREMSEEVREMSAWLIESGFQERLKAIGEGRRLTLERARELVDATPLTDAQALERGAVDALVNEEGLPAHLAAGGKPARIEPWEAAAGRLLRPRPVRPGRYVGLLVIEGTIIDGESGRPPLRPPIPVPVLLEPRAGDLTVVQAARRALKDRRAAAVVLYVNSGGGSVTASEAMRVALDRIQREKPLVVSMGPVAASGGYWVATPGRTILAQPSTITGSIGVLAGKLVAKGLLELLSVHRLAVLRGRHSAIGDFQSPFSREERKLVWSQIQRAYDLFLQRVSESRGLQTEAVIPISGGRVWTGRQALNHGLVDELGSLRRAFTRARELAGLDRRAPVRLIAADRRPMAPQSTVAALDYALEGLRLLDRPAPLALCPWTFSGEGS